MTRHAPDHRQYFRNIETDEIRTVVRGTREGDAELRTLRRQWHPKRNCQMWVQIFNVVRQGEPGWLDNLKR